MRIFVFDGVSESLRPREWAEALLKAGLDLDLSIDKLKDNDFLESWHSIALEIWTTWKEEQYETNRERKADWMETRNRQDAHTTLTIFEPNASEDNVAVVGDSPFFAFSKSKNKSYMFPPEFDHSTGPDTIGTIRSPSREDFNFTKIDLDDWDVVLACTDSIGDYLHENLSDLETCLQFLQQAKSEKWRKFLDQQLTLGRASGGLKDDDISMFMMERVAK